MNNTASSTRARLAGELDRAVELCDRVEREEVIPALLSGSRDSADRTERSQSADDVSRNLRAALRAPKPPEPVKPPLVRFLSWMGVLPG